MPIVQTPRGDIEFPDDMPLEQINTAVAQFMGQPESGTAGDYAVKALTPVNRAIAGVAGFPGDIESLLALGVNTGGKALGFDVGATNMLPSSEQIKQFMLDKGVPMKTAESAAGRIAQDAAQYGAEAFGLGGLGSALKGGAAGARMALSSPAMQGMDTVATQALKGAGGGLGDFMATQAAPLAATGAISGVGAAGAGEISDQNPLWRLGGGLAGAIVGGPLAARAFAPRLTPEQALAQVKANYADMSEGAQQAMAKLLTRGKSPVSSAAVAEAESLPVPVKLTRGQASRFDPDLRFEEGARQGRFGDAAARMFNPAQQQTALAENIPAIQQRIALTQPTVQPGQGGQAVQDALVQLEKKARGQYQTQYAAARDLKADLPVDVAQGVLDRATAAIADFHPTSSQQARAILADMQDEITRAPNGMVSLNALSTRLSQLGKAAGNSAQMSPEQAAAAAARSAGKDALHSIPGDQLPSSAQGFVEAWDSANSAYRDWAKLYKRNQGDIPNLAQKLTERGRMAGEFDQRAESPLSAILGGGRGLNASPRQLEQLKGVVGADSPEWNALRQDAWLKLMAPVQSQTGAAREISGVQINKIMDTAFRTNGKALDVLFSPEEQAMIRAYAKTAYAATAGPSKYNTASDMGNALTRLATTAGAHPLVAPFTSSIYGMARGGMRNLEPLTRNPSVLQGQRTTQAVPSILDLIDRRN
jgi:hypothetical protein